jgi:hypothetical protein
MSALLAPARDCDAPAGTPSPPLAQPPDFAHGSVICVRL